MQVTTIQGVVENGQIKLTESITLPDKTIVYVVVPSVEKNRIPKIMSPRLINKEDAEFFKKTVEDDVDGDL